MEVSEGLAEEVLSKGELSTKLRVQNSGVTWGAEAAEAPEIAKSVMRAKNKEKRDILLIPLMYLSIV